ncbi:MAG: SLC13 family permease [Gemmatimonadota bacterium]|nr:SLC13 family permease [Gemmatimonadota bacterium]MDQ8173186.1 SLC13 family permease [Gemmatimonadota bacterium]
MNVPLLLTATIVIVTVAALVREWAAPALVITMAMVALLVTGVTTPAEALAGFANPAPITVAALFIIARAVERTGALRPLLDRALRPDGTEGANLARLLSPVAFVSAFLNNTPIVAMLISPVTASAERSGQSVSKYLMPISFAALFGGMITLIGTSTNLVVSGLMEQSGYAPLGMFELTPVGLPLAIVGVLAMAVLAPRLLPARRGIKEQFSEEFREFTIEMEVEPDGPLVQRTVAEAGLRHLQGVFLGWIRRDDRVVSPVAPDEVLMVGDRLGFVGGVDRVMDLQSMPGLRMAAHKHVRGLDSGEHRFLEVVLAAISPLVGRTLKSADFREEYQATVLAIHRSGERIAGKLGEVPLEAGDTLLLLADRGFAARWRDRRDFLLVSQLDGALPVSSRKAWIVLVITAVMIVGAALDFIPILEGSLLAAMLMVTTGVLTPNEARNAVEIDVVLLIAASFGIGTAIETSGLAALVAGWIVTPMMALGPVAVLAAIVLATLVITELITNNAAAVLIYPIAVAAATGIGADPRAFGVAIAIAASASFLTPIGYQTNAMVFGPGGYRFGDYFRLGLPLTLLVFVGTVFLVALRWGMW